jgi:hypothetical protein
MSTQVAQVANSVYSYCMPTKSDDDFEPKDQRVHLMMTASELKAVDDWSWAQRIRSRGEAIRQLVALGLKAVAGKKSGDK